MHAIDTLKIGEMAKIMGCHSGDKSYRHKLLVVGLYSAHIIFPMEL